MLDLPLWHHVTQCLDGTAAATCATAVSPHVRRVVGDAMTQPLPSLQVRTWWLHRLPCLFVGCPQPLCEADSITKDLVQVPRLRVHALSLHGCALTDSHVAVLAQCNHLQVLSLAECRCVTDAGLEQLATALGQQLRALDLSGCTALTERGLRYLRGLTRLHTLVLKGGCFATLAHLVGDEPASPSNCAPHSVLTSPVKVLDLSACFAFDGDMERATAYFAHTEWLSLSGCPHLSDDALRHVAMGMRNLKVLHIANCRGITDEGLCAVGALLPRLTSLNVDTCIRVTDAGLAHVMACYSSSRGGAVPPMRTLVLRSCRISDSGLSNVARCTQLTYLNLDHCDRITDAGAACIAALRQLERLSLSAKCISDAGMACIGTLRTLRLFHMGCGERVTGVGVAHLAALVGLETLVLRVDSSIDLAFLRSLSKLRELTLRGCQFTEEGFALLSATIGPQLLCLDLNGTNASDAAIRTLSRRCVQLRSVSLAGCAGITDDGVMCLGALLQLERLDVSFCSQVQNMESLAGVLPRLRFFEHTGWPTDFETTLAIRSRAHRHDGRAHAAHLSKLAASVDRLPRLTAVSGAWNGFSPVTELTVVT